MKNKKQDREKKGQASVEVMIYISFFLLIFVTFTMFMLTQLHNDIVKRESILSTSVAAQIADATRMAINGGEGFSANFSIPKTINNKLYKIRFKSSGWIHVEIIDPLNPLFPVMYAYPLGFSNVKLYCAKHLRNIVPCVEGKDVDSDYTALNGKIYTDYIFSPSKGWMYLEGQRDTKDGFVIWVR